MNSDNPDFFHLLQLLWVPVIAVIGWISRILDRKADKDSVDLMIDSVKETLNQMRMERQTMHEENIRRLDIINRNILDIVGGRYSGKDP